MRKHEDVTEEYENSTLPKNITIKIEKGYDFERHKDELDMAGLLTSTIGGNVVLLAERDGDYAIRRPDYEWNGKYWELKTVKTVKGVDSAVRKALSQIYENPGGIILDFRTNKVKVSEIETAITRRMKTSAKIKVDVMVVISRKIEKVYRFM